MIHTATLTIHTNRELFQQFIQIQTTYWNRDTKCFYNYSKIDRGIRLYAYRQADQSFTYYQIVMRINFLRVIEQTDHVKLFSEQYTQAVSDKCNALLSELCAAFPPLLDWEVMRIDYCINIKTPHVQQYVKLMRKGDKPFQLALPTDKYGNQTQKAGSVYFGKAKNKKTTSYAINFYNKADQLKNEKAKQQYIDDAKDVLRIEIQCNAAKIDAIKKKYKLPNKSIRYFLNDEIALDTLIFAIQKITKTADFHVKSQTLQMIRDNTTFTKKRKARLIELIETVSKQHNSIWKYKRTLDERGKAQLRRDLIALEGLGLNAITISDNDRTLSTDEKRRGLKSVLALLMETIEHDT